MVNRKKIVFVIESLQLGGSEKSLVTLLQHLDPFDWDIHVLVFHKGGIFEAEIPTYVQLQYHPFPTLSVWERMQYKWKRSTQSGQRHSQQMLWPILQSKFSNIDTNYDIAVAYSQGFATYFTASFIQASKKYTWMNVDYVGAGYRFKDDAAYYKAFDAMVAVSPAVQQSMRTIMDSNALGLPIHCIPDIIDSTNIQQLATQTIPFNKIAGTIYIVTVGRLKEEKGLLLAIDACALLVAKGVSVEWLVVGEGSQRKALEQAIANKGLSAHFKLIGATNNPYCYMQACDIYVQTSLYEGLGLTLIEAAVLGKPIVTTDFPTAFDTITSHKSGTIVEKNATNIAAAIMDYIEHPDTAKEHGQLVQAKVLAAHQDTYQKVLTLLQS